MHDDDSSPTSSPRSRSWSTSRPMRPGGDRGDTVAPPTRPGHPAGWLGILHPFPSLLVAALVGVLAALAGGTPMTIATLALAMLGFQVSIGATNDLADLPRDRASDTRKPLPAGQVTVGQARIVAVVGGVLGLALSATLGAGVLVVGLAGYLCGIGYDLWLRRRGLAWVAYAAACPLVLVYAWLGAAGSLPPAGRCCCRSPRRSVRRSTCRIRSSTSTRMSGIPLAGSPAGSAAGDRWWSSVSSSVSSTGWRGSSSRRPRRGSRQVWWRRRSRAQRGRPSVW